MASVAVAPADLSRAAAAAGPTPFPALARITASQEGDVPISRIGHAAVTLVDPSRAPLLSSIYLFGGEASNPTPARNGCGGSPVYPKLGDVYEATPKSGSAALVWRVLTLPDKVQSPPEASTTTKKTGGSNGNGNEAATELGAAPIVPPPMAFHASCAACVPGSGSMRDPSGDKGSGDSGGGVERAMLIHGGLNQTSELLGDLWAFLPGRLSSADGGGGERGDGAAGSGDVGSVGSNGDANRMARWERLLPEGEG